MFSVPDYLLERIFVKDSLKNNESGFEFALRNVVDSGTLTRVMALDVDGQAVALDKVTFVLGEKARPAVDITPNATQYFPAGAMATVKVAGMQLSPGEHTLSLRVNTWEAGAVTIPIKGTVV